MQNWARNYRYQAKQIHFPKSVEEVQSLVRKSSRVRAIGTRHSFHHIADAEEGELISLAYLNRIVNVSLTPGRQTVTVEAGITYGQLCPHLDSIGVALPNLASLPHISIAGACATATHGSGDTLQSLASAVAAIRIVNASGDVEEFHRGQPGVPFDAMVVGLGGLGIVVELTLDLVDSFEIQQHVYERLELDAVKSAGFGAITASAYSVSLFTDWQNRAFNQVWFKSRPGERHFDLPQLGAVAATEHRHMVQGSWGEQSLRRFIDPQKCNLQLGQPGPWHQRLPHFRLEDEPSCSGEELQTEYLIHRDHAVPAFEALFALGRQIRPLIQISEVRTIAACELWMSPFFQRPSVAIHFTWRKQPEAVMTLLPTIEEALKSFAPRPHWGKIFAMKRPQLQAGYAGGKMDDFRALLQSRDPNEKFRNKFLRDYIA